MAKKFKILLVFISLSLTLCLMSNTYSRYVADTTGNLEVLFAKWQILVNENDITNNSSSSITLVPVVEKSDHVAENTVAPSSKGYFDINIDPTNIGVSFDYSITLSMLNKDIPDLMITKYAIIDDASLSDDQLTKNDLVDNKIDGTMDFNNKVENYKFKEFTIRIYFEWVEGTNEKMNDANDTQVGTKAATENSTFKVDANITFNQKI